MLNPRYFYQITKTLATYKGKLTETFKSVIIWTYRAVKNIYILSVHKSTSLKWQTHKGPSFGSRQISAQLCQMLKHVKKCCWEFRLDVEKTQFIAVSGLNGKMHLLWTYTQTDTSSWSFSRWTWFSQLSHWFASSICSKKNLPLKCITVKSLIHSPVFLSLWFDFLRWTMFPMKMMFQVSTASYWSNNTSMSWLTVCNILHRRL